MVENSQTMQMKSRIQIILNVMQKCWEEDVLIDRKKFLKDIVINFGVTPRTANYYIQVARGKFKKKIFEGEKEEEVTQTQTQNYLLQEIKQEI